MTEDHYFSHRPGAPSAPRRWTDRLRGRTLSFVADTGVFSSRRVDPGSRLLIESVDIPETGAVLDLGCGYGVLGVVVAVCYPKTRVTMVDVNERALALARENAAMNGVSRVEILKSDGFDGLGDRRFDLILTNPPFRQGKALVSSWLEGARHHLNPGGRLAMVVRTRQGALSWRQRLEAWYGSCREVAKGSGYRVYEVRASH